jgi:hypothetical protein
VFILVRQLVILIKDTIMRNFNNMTISSVQLFNNMTDEDFMYVHEAGKLSDLCVALSLDLQEKKQDDKERYEA